MSTWYHLELIEELHSLKQDTEDKENLMSIEQILVEENPPFLFFYKDLINRGINDPIVRVKDEYSHCCNLALSEEKKFKLRSFIENEIVCCDRCERIFIPDSNLFKTLSYFLKEEEINEGFISSPQLRTALDIKKKESTKVIVENWRGESYYVQLYNDKLYGLKELFSQNKVIPNDHLEIRIIEKREQEKKIQIIFDILQENDLTNFERIIKEKIFVSWGELLKEIFSQRVEVYGEELVKKVFREKCQGKPYYIFKNGVSLITLEMILVFEHINKWVKNQGMPVRLKNIIEDCLRMPSNEQLITDIKKYNKQLVRVGEKCLHKDFLISFSNEEEKIILILEEADEPLRTEDILDIFHPEAKNDSKFIFSLQFFLSKSNKFVNIGSYENPLWKISPEIPPSKAKATINDEMLSEGYLTITPYIKRIFHSINVENEVTFLTDGDHEISADVLYNEEKIKGKELAKWLIENKLREGDIVWIQYPKKSESIPRMYVEHTVEKKPPIKEPLDIPNILNREMIYEILSEEGEFLHIKEIFKKLQEVVKKKFEINNVRDILSSNPQIFSEYLKIRNLWGLNDWPEKETLKTIDTTSLAMAINEDDFIYNFLKNSSIPLSEKDIIKQIADYFRISVNSIKEANIFEFNDERLIRIKDGRWTIKEHIYFWKEDKNLLEKELENLKNELAKGQMIFQEYQNILFGLE